MKTKIIKIITSLVAALSIFSFATAPVFAADCENVCDPGCADQIPQSVIDAAGCDGGGDAKLVDITINVLNVIIGLLGIVAVIFIIIGGVNYMTSTGDANKVKKAKDTITYALIGLAICALSAIIVNFVIENIIK